MENIYIHINGLTHHDIAERREEFLAKAVGRTIVLRPAPMSFDARMLEAFVGADCVGVVARIDVPLAWRALSALGEGAKRLRGTIVDVAPYELTAEFEVEALGEFELEANKLGEWNYGGRVMQPWESMRKMDYLAEEIEAELQHKELDEAYIADLLKAFCDVAQFDISADGLALRNRLIQSLQSEGGEFRRKAAKQLREMSRIMGGDTWMMDLTTWLHTELPLSREAQPILLEPRNPDDVLAEAKLLPHDLWELYNHDRMRFVQDLYGLHPTREELLRVLSCLLWIDAHTVVDYNEDVIPLDELAECVLAEPSEERRYESMSVLNNLLSGKPQWASRASYIKEEIKKAHESGKGTNITLNQPQFDGPMYDVSGNSNVNIGGNGEESK